MPRLKALGRLSLAAAMLALATAAPLPAATYYVDQRAANAADANPGPEWPLENVHVLNNLLIRNTLAGEGHARGCELTVFMGCPADSYTRTVASNHSDGNVYADTVPAPTMRHSWNPDNTLAEWRERFGEDRRSKQMPVRFEFKGTAFRLLSREGMETAVPLPETLGWKPPAPGLVGAARAQWP